MPEAQLTITLPRHLWIAAISREHPTAVFRVLAAIPGDRSGYALVRVIGADVPEIIDAMERHPQLIELTLIQRSDGEATIQFETTAPLLLFCSQASGLPITLPVDIVNGEATVEVTGSTDRLGALADELRDFCFDFEVDYVQEHVHSNQLLSDRQRELVIEAAARGYYDSPRGCTLTELAEAIGIAKSSCSETLQRAEGTIIKHFLLDIGATFDENALEADAAPVVPSQ